LIGSVELNDKYQKPKFHSNDTDSYKALYVKYDNFKSADFSSTSYTDFQDFKDTNSIYKDEEGVIFVEVQLLDGSVAKIPAIGHINNNDVAGLINPFTESVINTDTGTVNSNSMHYDDESGNSYTINLDRMKDLNSDITSEYNNIIDLIRNAVSDAQSADISEQELLQVLNSSQLEGEASKSNIASFQTAYASMFGDTQKNPQDTNIVLTDANTDDNKITVKTPNGTKRIDLSEEGVNLVTTNDADVPTKSDGSDGLEKGGTYTAGEGTYVVDESTGEMYKVPDGQTVQADNITKTTTDKDGNETTTSKDSVDYTNTDLNTDQINELKDRLDAVDKQIEAVNEIKEKLKNSSGGGGLFGDSGSGILGIGLIGVVVAYIYGTQNSDSRSNRR
jgi:hypothetical protein